MMFHKEKSSCGSIWLADNAGGLSVEVLEDFCRSFPAFADQTAAPDHLWTLHDGGRSTIYGAELSGRKYVVKLYKDRRILTQLRTFLGFSKGRRAFSNGLRTQMSGLPVPQTYAYVEKRPLGPTMVVMEFLEESTQINLLLEERLANGVELTNDPFFVQLVDAFARFTREMHGKGISHSDFSPRNVLVSRQGDELRMKLIDLEDVVFSDRPRFFKADIAHFDERMARYVDDAALNQYLTRFNELYRENVLDENRNGDI